MKKPSATLPELKRELATIGVEVSTATLSRRLTRELGLKSYRPAKKPKITPRMAKARLGMHITLRLIGTTSCKPTRLPSNNSVRE